MDHTTLRQGDTVCISAEYTGGQYQLSDFSGELLFARPLSGLFVDSETAAKIVRTYFLIIGIGYILNTVTNCFLGAVNGMGKPVKSLCCMILYYLIVRMPLAWLLSFLGFGLNGIWTAVLVSHIVAAAAACLIGNLELKGQERILSGEGRIK